MPPLTREPVLALGVNWAAAIMRSEKPYSERKWSVRRLLELPRQPRKMLPMNSPSSPSPAHPQQHSQCELSTSVSTLGSLTQALNCAQATARHVAHGHHDAHIGRRSEAAAQLGPDAPAELKQQHGHMQACHTDSHVTNESMLPRPFLPTVRQPTSQERTIRSPRGLTMICWPVLLYTWTNHSVLLLA